MGEKLSKRTKIILGIATLWPIIYVGLFIVLWFTLVFVLAFTAASAPSSSAPAAFPPAFPVFFFAIMALHFLTMLWSLALLAIYIVDVFKNKRMDQEKKALWAVVLFLGNVFAMIVYWYLYVWREPQDSLEGTSPRTP